MRCRGRNQGEMGRKDYGKGEGQATKRWGITKQINEDGNKKQLCFLPDVLPLSYSGYDQA